MDIATTLHTPELEINRVGIHWEYRLGDTELPDILIDYTVDDDGRTTWQACWGDHGTTHATLAGAKLRIADLFHALAMRAREAAIKEMPE